MKKQKTLSYGFLHHLYEEKSNNAEVFLELEEIPITLSVLKGGRSGIKLSIPIEEWRKIISDWSESEWANGPERDHQRSQITPEQFEQFLKGFQARHPEIFTDGVVPDTQ
jgi:hypothetical protein